MAARELFEEKTLRMEMAELGAANILKRFGIIKDEISQRQAYERFGEARIKSWKNRGLVSRVKCGERNSKVTYSLIELGLLDKLEKQNQIKN
ncbi:MAG: hypothetical protein RR313_11725 [Anaerovoracaceae bacterium]